MLIDQPDLGQSILLIFSWTATVFISGISLFYIIGFFSIFLISISSLLLLMPEKFGYIINRLVSFIDPSKGDKFQSTSALDAIKLGGLKGQGMGERYFERKCSRSTYRLYNCNYFRGIWINYFCNDCYSFLYISFRIIKNCINQNDQVIKISLCGLAALIYISNFYPCWG